MRWRESLLNAFAVLGLGSSVVTAGVVVRRELRPPVSAATRDAEPIAVANWERFLTTGRRIGPADAGVTLIEFGDYQCPACRGFEQMMERLRAKYPGELAVVYHYLPLPYHKRAYPAARAAECAADQGRFEAMHKELYAHFESLDTIPFLPLARAAGVADLRRFEACVADADPHPAIERDKRWAVDTLHVQGTPTVIANGKMFALAPPYGELEQMLADARDRRKELTAKRLPADAK